METQTVTKYGGSAKEARDGFKISAIARNLTPSQAEALQSFGLASVLYRAGASAINRELGVENNSQVEFNDADAAKIAKFLPVWARGDNSPIEGGFDLEVTLTRHVHGEGAEPKYADEKKAIRRHIEARDIVVWAEKTVGYTGGGALDTDNVALLQAVKAYKIKVLKAAM